MKVSDYIVKYLAEKGVKCIFGYTGGAVTHLVDSIYKSNIEFMTCYHEQAASFSASAAAKLTGSLQVAIATSGPGATNLITGIADSYFDSTPVLFITGQVNTYDFKYDLKIRQKGFQETDIVNIVKPIVKYCALIDKPESIIEELAKAVEIATSGRMGPVLLDIPMNVQRAEIEDKRASVKEISNNLDLNQSQIEKIVNELKDSKFPLILVGGGCTGNKIKSKIISFAESLEIPVVVSLMGKDSFPNNHALFGGFIGSYGNRYGNIMLASCDTLLVLGSRLDSRQTGNILTPFLNKNIIWVDIDKEEMISHKIQNTFKINTDVSIFLDEVNRYIFNQKINIKRGKIIDFLNFLKDKYNPLNELKRESKDNWHYLMLHKISEYLDKDDIVCVDVGQNQMLAAQTLEIKENQRFINSGGMASMGVALPSAIGANKISGRRTIVICGDGGLQMNIQELNTISKNNLPVIVIVLNNKSLGMIKQFQELYFESRFAATDVNSGYFSCDFKKIAEAYNIKSYRLNEKSENVEETFKEVFKNHSNPVLLELDIDYFTYISPKLRFDLPLDKLSPELNNEEEEEIKKRLSKIKDEN